MPITEMAAMNERNRKRPLKPTRDAKKPPPKTPNVLPELTNELKRPACLPRLWTSLWLKAIEEEWYIA